MHYIKITRGNQTYNKCAEKEQELYAALTTPYNLVLRMYTDCMDNTPPKQHEGEAPGSTGARALSSKNLNGALKKTANSLKQFLPVLIGVVLLLGLALTVIPSSSYGVLFQGNDILDPLLGAVLGSVLGGNPITSYVIGGELLQEGVGLAAVTAFLLSWVTVGIIQLPAESLMLGRAFAIARNVVSFFAAILVALLTVTTLSLL